MKLKMYSIKDIKMNKLNQPFYAPNDEIAKRMLHNTVNTETEDNFLSKYPEDYQMFRVGEFTEETGEITSEVEFLCSAVEMKKTKWEWKTKEDKKIDKMEKEIKGEFENGKE